jgi:hypothetical protein
MAEARAFEPDEPELPPPGQRSGAGAQSVLPYLTKTLQAKPAHAADPREARARDTRPADGADGRPAA